MGVERAVRPDDARLGSSQLAATVNHFAFCPHAWRLGWINGRDQIDAELGGGVAASHGHQGVHRTAQGRDGEVESLDNGGLGQPTAKHSLLQFDTSEMRHLVRASDAGARVGIQAGNHVGILGHPGIQHGGC